MPGFYADGEYDIAGFIVGVVEQSRLIDGRSIVAGDTLIGLPSAGLHTNGYSLARRVLFDDHKLSPSEVRPELGTSLADALLAPHRSYLKAVRPLLDAGVVKGLAHITGGGITENLPRILPEGCGAIIHPGMWSVPPLFTLLQTRGAIPVLEMFRVFNMGIGLIVACSADRAHDVLILLAGAGEREARIIGQVTSGDRTVRYSP